MLALCAGLAGCGDEVEPRALETPRAPVDSERATAERNLYALPAPGSTTATPTAAPSPVNEAAPGVVPPDPAEGADTAITDVSAFAAERATSGSATLETITVYGKQELPGVGVPQVRAVLGFDAVAAFRRGERQAEQGLPRSVFLDLDGVQVGRDLSPLVSVHAGGLERIRAFALDDHSARVSFDLAPNGAYRLFFLTNPYRVIMDFRVQAPRRPDADGKQLRTIVLDPGHGGSQDGARAANGIEESVVVLAIAQRVKRLLQSKLPGTRIVLTRDRDRTVTLEERSAIANGVDADLFVSIHLNSTPVAKDRGGVSTYVLDTSNDEQALRLAARENDAAERDVTDLQRLFASLYRKDQVARSLELANAIQRSTLAEGRKQLPELADRGVQKALFYVLVGATMPAVLCEASFLSRPEEAAALATDTYRDALAEGISEGIVAYARKAARDRPAPAASATPGSPAKPGK
ncbi:MAG TPA: N-acetylmuramoyl-L-alanine amidase [Polyangiales bacterium]|nr:N-acetylmuramoyl-L-alanine amidase [Polyangiales bacterium]